MSYQIGPMDPEDRAGHFAEGADAPPRRVAAIFAVVVVMAVFAGGLWFAYTVGLRHSGGAGGGNVPLIRADAGPTKVKPQNPGGMKIPDRNLAIYNERRPTVERLLPGPEQPLPRPAPPPPKPEVAAATASPAPPPAPPAATPPAQTAAPSPPAAAMRETPALPAAPPSLPTKPAAMRPAAASASGVALQLGALRSEAAAHQEWVRIRRTSGDLLGKLSIRTVRADLGDKGVFWRIETGPIADRAAAVRLCTELKRRNIGCLLAR